jgi:endonuclease/exonuclease/phosphatase family metal-dependent hydrolase
MKRTAGAVLVSALLVVGAAGAAAAPWKVLTYNVGLLRAFGSDLVPMVEPRAAAAPAELARFASENGPQIILLEEIWRDSYAQAIEKALAPLGYASAMPLVHSIIGLNSGLLLLVRSPLEIVDWSFTPFTRTTFTDSFARKGVLQATLRNASTGAQFVLIGTHTVAVDTIGGVPKDKEQLGAIAAQVAQIRAALSARSRDGAIPAILLGDFNVGPGYVDAIYRAITEGSTLTETGAAAASDGPLITWDPGNPLVKFGGYPDEPPAKIDHVFLQDGDGSRWSTLGATVVLREPVAGLRLTPKGRADSVPVPLSDHYGFLVEIEMRP